jgi:hypothetical protein
MTTFSAANYEEFLYSLVEQYPEISRSTLHLYANSPKTAFTRGSVYFCQVLKYVDTFTTNVECQFPK